ncbi:MAG: hypothetical protein ACR2PX_21130 [Endozoicomonas sp.]|uniref:hypothetical protein n=1 Tax=Endozoicomonas sp. TaxID=1892382 RepID=UPI003D9B8A28
MSFFRITNDFENYWSFNISNVELFSKMPTYDPRFKAQSRLSDWVQPDAEFYPSENYSGNSDAPKIPDITTWLYGNLILNEKAFQCLENDLAPYGEFLPVNCEGKRYFAFNTLYLIDDNAINQELSEQDIQDGIYMGVKKLGFIESAISSSIFKTSFDRTLYSYCSNKFIKKVQGSNLQGLIFLPTE